MCILQEINAAVIDISYFRGNNFPKILGHNEIFWLDITCSLHVRILILSREVGHSLSV